MLAGDILYWCVTHPSRFFFLFVASSSLPHPYPLAGGGELLSSWDYWTDSSFTYCLGYRWGTGYVKDYHCRPWTLNETFISSGDNKQNNYIQT